MTFVSELEPQALWKHFDHILTIPRGSKNEAAMRQYVIQVAERHGLEHQEDEAGNVVVRKAGRGSGSSPTILQSHLDMVNEKNTGVEHDFRRDPIVPRREGEYLKASGTTLGSDNGIGVATQLALLESEDLVHGPLECLFTVDEETGLTGAAGLSPEMLSGKRLINLDTEEEHSLYIGCAGGEGVNLDLPLEYTSAPLEALTLELRVHGLRGGHSGTDIHLGRGNSIKLLARALHHVMRSTAFELAELGGGNMHNAIPREASARVVLSPEGRVDFEQKVQEAFADIQRELGSADPEAALSIREERDPERVFSPESTRRLLFFLNALPHGVISMSQEIPDLVETSSNLATVRTQDAHLHIHVSNRSSVASALEAIQERVGAIGMLAGARVAWTEGYPGWQPDLESGLLKVCRAVHTRVFGEEPEIKVVHAGLECGIIKKKYPHIDMISIGPQIEFPHSPDERVKIQSVAEFYQFLTAVLEELSGQ